MQLAARVIQLIFITLLILPVKLVPEAIYIFLRENSLVTGLVINIRLIYYDVNITKDKNNSVSAVSHFFLWLHTHKRHYRALKRVSCIFGIYVAVSADAFYLRDTIRPCIISSYVTQKMRKLR